MRPWLTAGVRVVVASVTRDILSQVKDFAAGLREDEVLPESLFGDVAE